MMPQIFALLLLRKTPSWRHLILEKKCLHTFMVYLNILRLDEAACFVKQFFNKSGSSINVMH